MHIANAYVDLDVVRSYHVLYLDHIPGRVSHLSSVNGTIEAVSLVRPYLFELLEPSWYVSTSTHSSYLLISDCQLYHPLSPRVT